MPPTAKPVKARCPVCNHECEVEVVREGDDYMASLSCPCCEYWTGEFWATRRYVAVRKVLGEIERGKR